MSEASSKSTTDDYEKDAFEEEPIEEYVELEDGYSNASDNTSEISEEANLEGSLDDIATSTADMEISSNAPSDFNSDDHAFHLNFIQDSMTKLPEPKKKYKNGTRSSLSFSNDRMREIERHNQILLQKILSKGPSCTSLTSQRTSFNNAPVPARTSSAAINRKKLQRQIDLDNQVLKRKIEQIALRRPRSFS